MSLQAVRIGTRIVSTTFIRRATALSAVGHQFQSPVSHTLQRYVSKSPDSKDVSVKAKEQGHKTKTTVAEKGDMYKAGETYYNFNPYSFYDIENEMKSHRQPQPNSGGKAQ